MLHFANWIKGLVQHAPVATFLSTPDSSLSRPTVGERRFAARLSRFLEDDYLCWYEPPIGPRHQHPDFLILHPARGLLVLEVKDWNLSTIGNPGPHSFTLDTAAGPKATGNPLRQARQYAQAVVNLLERDLQLTNPPGTRFVGRLNFPYGYGVVLTRITRRQFETSGLCDVLQPHLVICSDEMTESVDAEEFQSRLWAMFNVRFESKLTLPQVERIRWILFPEIRILQPQLPMESVQNTPQAGDGTDANATDNAPIPDLLQVMDLAQEEIARNLGDGHRVIHGVAGSGKTLILAYRCRFLARTLAKPILVLVFNRSLAAWLKHQFEAQGLAGRVTVRHFHGWCRDQLLLYHEPLPAPADSANHYADALVQSVVRGVDRGQIPRAQYGAVLIDEGHDFSPDWLKLAVQMLDPESNHLLLLYDDAQSIYGEKRARSFSFKSLGIAAQGRTKILRRNYRNTREILDCARTFAKELLAPVDADEDGVPLIFPEAGGRDGARPRFARLASVKLEAAHIARELRSQHGAGVPWNEMGVFYTVPFVANELVRALQESSIPFDWLKDAASKSFDPSRQAVKLMTPHSSKGLQYRVAIIAGIGCWPYPSAHLSAADQARLLYVAMTRATHELVLTSSKPSQFSERLKALCA